MSVPDVCRKLAWRPKCSGMQATWLRELDDENRRLEQLAEDQALDFSLLREVNVVRSKFDHCRPILEHWLRTRRDVLHVESHCTAASRPQAPNGMMARPYFSRASGRVRHQTAQELPNLIVRRGLHATR